MNWLKILKTTIVTNTNKCGTGLVNISPYVYWIASNSLFQFHESNMTEANSVILQKGETITAGGIGIGNYGYWIFQNTIVTYDLSTLTRLK